MGGLGSGNHWRYGSKATCESFTRIELPVLRRRGMLQPGYYGSLSWNMGGESCGNIRFRMHKSGMELIYKYQEHGAGEWQHVNEHVPFLYTAQHIPGIRRWFGCLSCGRRCTVLYGGTHYRCRKCWNLAYQSQHEAPYQRALSKAQKFRQRLGGSPCTDDPFPEKPKGMHWRTYDRFVERGEAFDEQAEQAGMAMFGRLLQMVF
jgi:hypothetical protein